MVTQSNARGVKTFAHLSRSRSYISKFEQVKKDQLMGTADYFPYINWLLHRRDVGWSWGLLYTHFHSFNKLVCLIV
tara:strand:- start:152 stop:379 length:228 start_codon:yes stop_codon:yes gene_type:complete